MNTTKIFLHISSLIVFVKLFEGILDKTKTEIISVKAIEALKDPLQKRLIDKVFDSAKQSQIKTGVYISPQLEL